MPWKRVQCPDGKEVPFEQCLECDHECFDLEIREALFEREKNWQAIEHTGNHISVTALLGCMRSTFLERVTDFAATPESQWWSLRGELIHRLVERPDMDNPYMRRSEMRLRAIIDGAEISGQLDNYKARFLEAGVLKDWKSIGDNGLQYVIFGGAKEDHIRQANIYAWIARQNGYRIDRIEIAYLSLMQVIKTGQTVSFCEVLKGPPRKGGKRKNMVGDPKLVKEYPSGKNQWECLYEIPEVPVFTDDQVLDFVAPRLARILHAFKTGLMPPRGDQELRKWKCNGYCRVAHICKAQEELYSDPR